MRPAADVLRPHFEQEWCGQVQSNLLSSQSRRSRADKHCQPRVEEGAWGGDKTEVRSGLGVRRTRQGLTEECDDI
jgi:hypothetical protein